MWPSNDFTHSVCQYHGCWCTGPLCHQVRGRISWLVTNWTFDKFLVTYFHCNDVIMNSMASQITGVSIVYSTVCSGADQRKPESFASLSFVWGIYRWPVNSPHKRPVTQKMFPFDDVIMRQCRLKLILIWIELFRRIKNTFIYFACNAGGSWNPSSKLLSCFEKQNKIKSRHSDIQKTWIRSSIR